MSAAVGAISTRLVGPDAAWIVLDVMRRCWAGTVASDSTAYLETRQVVAAQLERGGGALAFSGDTPIGGGRFLPVPGPPRDPRHWVEIKRVGVLRAYRKAGLGAELVHVLEGEARRRGYAGAQLGVRADQPRLVSFWSRLGYLEAVDVVLHTENPLTPKPTHMRKLFA
ncbi:MAG: GNAT family N-acetyltransferase [Alphaproteobacteria bacterium]|nr:GNAT family N-acetyltransferase [Alphaproteobacteria bacterium]